MIVQQQGIVHADKLGDLVIIFPHAVVLQAVQVFSGDVIAYSRNSTLTIRENDPNPRHCDECTGYLHDHDHNCPTQQEDY